MIRFMTLIGTELTLRSNPQKVGYNPKISLKVSLTTGKLDLIVISSLLFVTFGVASTFLNWQLLLITLRSNLQRTGYNSLDLINKGKPFKQD